MTTATEQKHKEELIKCCYKQVNDQTVPKTKTVSIVPLLESDTYKREPIPEILLLSKYETKVLIISRFGMLECGKNFRGTLPEQCITCNEIDTEEHRMNVCTKYININHFHDDKKLPFDTIFSSNVESLRAIIQKIEKVWNVSSGHGTMNT